MEAAQACIQGSHRAKVGLDRVEATAQGLQPVSFGIKVKVVANKAGYMGWV